MKILAEFSPRWMLLLFWLAQSVSVDADDLSTYVVEDVIEVAEVVSEFRVRFCLLTEGKKQYVAYYDKKRKMTVASRDLESSKWEYQILPSSIGWDSHNYITMAVDTEGNLHVSGNMHADPLVYFRTVKPGDISTLKSFPMIGEQENRTTYPNFLKNEGGKLVFNYRDGGSGRGKRIYNEYDVESRTWSRMLKKALLDGEGERNAYPSGPKKGPDDWYHMIWVWRDTPDCATNHHLSYAKSRDLKNWQSAFGDEVKLPLTLGQEKLWVDPVPPGGGMINGGAKLSFDSKKRPLISYHKADEAGNMQIYAARPMAEGWERKRLTNWAKPIEFSGFGSMGNIGIQVSRLEQVKESLLVMSFQHRDYGRGRLFIDETTLKPSDIKMKIPKELPDELSKMDSDFRGMLKQRAGDSGNSEDSSVRYMLQWESLGSNHDKPRKGLLPEPSVLKLYKLRLRK
ncbi:MAG: BNR repeat-containing protein [Akkermansiaceae bacterium]